jgi:putative restriction endonuclease
MLASPVFLPRESWVNPPAGWPENSVQGKGYDIESGEGARVWADCKARLVGLHPATLIQEPSGLRHGAPALVQPRLGQGLFRVSVADAYRRACAVTGEHSLPALEAAHIRPYEGGGEHKISNGLLLRSDIHRLFDRGYVGVTPDLRFIVSDQLKHQFSNGRSYYPFMAERSRNPISSPNAPTPARSNGT